MGNASANNSRMASDRDHPGYTVAMVINEWAKRKRLQGYEITVAGEEGIKHKFDGIICKFRPMGDGDWSLVGYSLKGGEYGAYVDTPLLKEMAVSLEECGRYSTLDVDGEPLSIVAHEVRKKGEVDATQGIKQKTRRRDVIDGLNLLRMSKELPTPSTPQPSEELAGSKASSWYEFAVDINERLNERSEAGDPLSLTTETMTFKMVGFTCEAAVSDEEHAQEGWDVWAVYEYENRRLGVQVFPWSLVTLPFFAATCKIHGLRLNNGRMVDLTSAAHRNALPAAALRE